jgi:hypothetical protein
MTFRKRPAIRSTSARHMSSPFAEDELLADHPLKNTAVCAENLVRLMW